MARVVTPGSTATTLILYRYLARRDGAADAPRSYADEKLYRKNLGVPTDKKAPVNKEDGGGRVRYMRP